ncbi:MULTISPECIES: DNA-formamidopyrimidine glycosylase family protein [Microbacterium]|uniref:DNA-formamidopyrimidine glycosylase family protein n=1 Tax=Microbacterium TaxID=33882 RepID=UPI002780331B|nr:MULTISPECIES: DNA-formamidopyrimidine glycosylase family protein [Microbacterium]MDQ1083366.1 endonuclease-8 [Microbacterium sp. SORGH_AS_0344]MDQ1171354.1 endonuclease-8 [Microbacterium proteolyticum]
MPEGDSVYRLRQRLDAATRGARVLDGELRSGNAAGRSLAGRDIVGYDTHGKHLLTRFDDGSTLHTHLRMQGSWTITRPGRSLPSAAREKARVRLRLGDGREVWGLDLPVVELVPTARERDVVGRLGPDPLREDWDAAEAVRRLSARPERAFVAALLDQTLMAGLGNLWVNEVAFLRGIHPFAPIGATDVDALVVLAARCLRVSATVPGMYQVTTGDRRRGASHWVAGRAGRPCRRCGTRVRVRDEVANDPEQRRTWWCPRCQPMPAEGDVGTPE